MAESKKQVEMPDMPNLSMLMSVEPDKNMMESMSISKSMTQSIPLLLSIKKNMENI